MEGRGQLSAPESNPSSLRPFLLGQQSLPETAGWLSGTMRGKQLPGVRLTASTWGASVCRRPGAQCGQSQGLQLSQSGGDTANKQTSRKETCEDGLACLNVSSGMKEMDRMPRWRVMAGRRGTPHSEGIGTASLRTWHLNRDPRKANIASYF